MDKNKKAETIAKYRINDKDCGSADVQIAVLTENIRHLTGHLDTHKKDNHTKRSILVMVGQRKRLSNYLRRTAPARYAKLAEGLGIK